MYVLFLFHNCLCLTIIYFQGDSSAQSESHKSESEDIGVEMDEEIESQIVLDSEGPTPCKVARKQLLERSRCDGGSSTDADVEGIIQFLCLEEAEVLF